MTRIELNIALADAADRPPSSRIAATAFLPPPGTTHADRVVFAFPGAGYGRRYFDLEIPGRDGYSQAAHHVARGMVFIACDHLGVGDSTLEGDGERFSLETVAAANAEAVARMAAALADGTLAEDYPALPGLVAIGMGQSMGGSILMLMQARHRCFDAIALLGSSAIENVILEPDRAATEARRAFFASLAALAMGLPATVPDFAPTSPRHAFHFEDVPDDIVRADLGAGGYPLRDPMPEWASATIPKRGIEVMARGRLAAEAAAIVAPVMLAFGERDVALDPHTETAAFPRATDVSLFIVPRMAHMHNFATTRAMLWNRLAAWSSVVAATRLARHDGY